MFAHPGKKLNFMGNEIGSFREFDEAKELDWFLLDYPRHDSFLRYFTDLNKIYAAHGCLYKHDYGALTKLISHYNYLSRNKNSFLLDLLS